MYHIERAQRSAAAEILPWALAIIGVLLLGSVYLRSLQHTVELVGAEAVRARVISFEKHGYPIADENWLRFEVVEGVYSGVNVALQVPTGVRVYEAGDMILVCHRSTKGSTALGAEQFTIVDPRQSGAVSSGRLVGGGVIFVAGLAIFISRRRTSETQG